MAKDEDARFGDGTQAAAFDDALSEPAGQPVDDFQLTRVASPVQPDPDVARRLVDAELAGDRPADQSGGDAPPAGPADPIAPAPPLGMAPRQRRKTVLRRPSLRLPRISLPDAGTGRRVRPSSGSTGIIVALVLMIVFVVLAVEFVTSLIGSITAAFT
ncbi:MAG TPA: hypothetical protein VFG87_00305 [Amycolatopsis sp.]|nr:hypothetical protein [Amycolatopsis sp.]